MGKLALKCAIIDAIISLGIVFYNTDNIEVDWTSYVSQGEAFLDGIYDYNEIWGPRGYNAYLPLHNYIYGFLTYTGISYNFLNSQLLWTFLHVIWTYVRVNLAEMVFPQEKHRIICAALFLLQYQERHFTLLFLQNDFLMAFAIIVAVQLMLKNQVLLSMVFMIVALSIKIGAVMWLPGYLLVLTKKRSILSVLFFFGVTLAVLYKTSLPYIEANADAYFGQILGIGRRLPGSTTTLYFVVPNSIFLTDYFLKIAVGLLLLMNVVFLVCVWTNWRKFFSEIRIIPSFKLGQVDSFDALKIICTSALIQIIFTHQSHTQFLLWYSPIFPILLTMCDIQLKWKCVFALILDYCVLIDKNFYHPLLKYAAAYVQLYLLYLLFRDKTIHNPTKTEIKKE